MPPLRPPVSPANPLASARALADCAVAVHSPHMLKRGGPYQRSLSLVARGTDPLTAGVMAAAQGKGHVAELAQSAHYTAAASVFGQPLRARPNPRANDPRTDVEVLRRRRRTHGSQLKVGSRAYLRRSVRVGRYENLIVNAESMDAVADFISVRDRLDHRGIQAPQLTAAEAELTATTVLHRMLLEQDALGPLGALWHSTRAGLADGLTSFGLELAGQLADSAFRGTELHLPTAIRSSFVGGARSAARSGLETWFLLDQFVTRARRAFSSRLLQRIAKSRIVVSAVAEVVVETAIDLVDVLRNRMTFEDLLRRFGVHVATAGGAALGVSLALTFARGLGGLPCLLLAVAGGYLGSRAGRAAGEALFLPEHLVPLQIQLA